MGRRMTKGLDIDRERQQLVDAMMADHGSHWAEQYKPGSFGCHELLDRTALLAGTVEHFLLTHPACVQNKDWFALAQHAVAALQELYQRIGEEHLNDR